MMLNSASFPHSSHRKLGKPSTATSPSMKFLFATTIATLASLVAATPTPTVEKRAITDEKCNIGYASTNGG